MVAKEIKCPLCGCPRSYHRPDCVMGDAGGGNCACRFFNPATYKVIFCGDREWWDKTPVEIILAGLPKTAYVIHGAARGLDRMAGDLATDIGLRVVPVPANWDEFHRSAGPIRNRLMASYEPRYVFAFHDDIMRSRGTKDMVQVAANLGIPFWVVSH